MTAERYSTPRHNLHAVQAGSADNCASGARSSPPWRMNGWMNGWMGGGVAQEVEDTIVKIMKEAASG